MSRHDPMIEIMRERERLLARCNAQRTELKLLVRQWEDPLAVADRAVAAINYLRQHPVVLGALVALLAVIQRRGLWGWAGRGFALWRAYRAFHDAKIGLTA
jgi:hypothetical protein